MRIFLDTSVLSDRKLAEVGDELAKRRLAGDEFYISVMTHFQILWGYLSARLSPARMKSRRRRNGTPIRGKF